MQNRKTKRIIQLATILSISAFFFVFLGIFVFHMAKDSKSEKVAKAEGFHPITEEEKELLEGAMARATVSDTIDTPQTDTQITLTAGESSALLASANPSESSTDDADIPKTVDFKNEYLVCIDPGHQAESNTEEEPNAPDSDKMKAKVSAGTKGVSTGIPESELTLDIGLLLREELNNRGIKTFMTRTTQDVDISNKERAERANTVGADVTIRLHADGNDDNNVNGASMIVASESNPYVYDNVTQSHSFADKVLGIYCAETGIANKGVREDDTMTGINWCKMPVAILEMGFMTNEEEDKKMQDPEFQKKMASAIADGIEAYIAELDEHNVKSNSNETNDISTEHTDDISSLSTETKQDTIEDTVLIQ